MLEMLCECCQIIIKKIDKEKNHHCFDLRRFSRKSKASFISSGVSSVNSSGCNLLFQPSMSPLLGRPAALWMSWILVCSHSRRSCTCWWCLRLCMSCTSLTVLLLQNHQNSSINIPVIVCQCTKKFYTIFNHVGQNFN